MALTVSGGLPIALGVAIATLVAFVVVVATLFAALGLLVFRTVRALGKSNFGMCPGTQQDDRPEPALIDWLHERIQSCAGRPLDEPLTFRDLEEQGVRLTMMTTDLSLARPVRVPDGLDGYWFKPGDFEGFPKSVVDAMAADAEAADAAYRPLAVADLPILVGVRLSLSFPILLSAVPLYRGDSGPDGDRRRHLFSDGGISSNFPIHFFDAWFPGRPTFGIDLARHPGGDAEDVFLLADPLAPTLPRWGDVDTVFAFAEQIKDTMQNWRDTLQSELPGYRDRVCQIRFGEGQGGFHFNMGPSTIEDLVSRGAKAGRKIRSTFDERHWRQHRWVRYLTLMAQLQDNLHHFGEPFGMFASELGEGLPDVTVFRDRRDPAWCARANEATATLLALAGEWGPAPMSVDLDGVGGPLPRPVMRIVPSA